MLQKLVLRLDPELPVDELKPMQTWVDDSMVSRRSPALLAGIFAAVALLLAAVGTYGVLAYAVNQRRREIGVRMALGAQPRDVIADVMGQGLRLAAVGVVAGIFLAVAGARLLNSLLFGTSPTDTLTFVAAATLLVAIAALASLVPALRASRVDPLIALRDE